MKSKTTKRALLSSCVALMLCFSMLLGTTYAWFTDTASTGVNMIQSGTLDIQLLDKSGENSLEGESFAFQDVDGNTNILWEPGVTFVTQGFQIKNAGSLALKYKLIINGVTDGSSAKLLEVIDFYVTDTDPKAYETGEAYFASCNKLELADFVNKFTPLAPNGQTDKIWGNSYDYVDGPYYLVGHMDEEANNDYQNQKIEGVGLTVYATQVDAEYDSFDNQYDADAIMGTPIYTTEEFYAALENAEDGPVYMTLMSDDVVWTTGAEHGSTPFIAADSKVSSITIDGNGHVFTADGAGVGSLRAANGAMVTFKNMTIVDNSKSYNESAWEFTYLEFAGNLMFDNVTFKSGVQFQTEGKEATLNASFVDCTFISEEDSVYAAWVSDGVATFENCTFSGTRGLKVHEAYGSEVDSVVVDNCEFGPLSKKPGVAIGTLNANTSISLTNNLFAGTQAGEQSNYKYETDTDVTTFSFVDENNTVAGYVDTPNDLNDAITNDATVVLDGGDYTLPSLANYEGVTLIGAADGSTVVGGENATTGFASNFGKDTKIQNVTFSGAENGVRWSYAKGGTSIFDNCTFAGDSVYGFHIDQSNGATFIFNNCTFVGFNAFAGDLEKVEFNNCTFLSNGSYGHTNIWSKGYFNNCTWGDETSVSPAGSGKLYFNGVQESYHHEYVGSAESLVAFAKSVNEGGDSWTNQAVILVDDIDLENQAWTPIGQTGATEFRGIFDGQGYTISNLNIDSSAQTGEHYSSGLFGWAERGVTIQNVKVDGATVVGNHNVAVICGYTYSAKISNCHVTNANITCKHANDDACGDKAGLIGGYVGNEARISDCSATDCTVTAGRDAGQLIGCGYNVSVSNCAATNVNVTAGGDCTGANINEAIIGRVMS